MSCLKTIRVPAVKTDRNAQLTELSQELFDEIGRILPKAIGDAPGTAMLALPGRVGFLLTKQVPPTPYRVPEFPSFPERDNGNLSDLGGRARFIGPDRKGRGDTEAVPAIVVRRNPKLKKGVRDPLSSRAVSDALLQLILLE